MSLHCMSLAIKFTPVLSSFTRGGVTDNIHIFLYFIYKLCVKVNLTTYHVNGFSMFRYTGSGRKLIGQHILLSEKAFPDH